MDQELVKTTIPPSLSLSSISPMVSSLSQRAELAKHCTSRDWSKAIRVLDSIISQSSSTQDFCNRAFCYSQMELHKHVIKDCDRALQLDPALLQAYILKGHSVSALGKKEDALLVFEQGYEYALRQSSDLKQLLELEELLAVAKQSCSVASKTTQSSESSFQQSESGTVSSVLTIENCNNQVKQISDTDNESQSGSSVSSKVHKEPKDIVDLETGSIDQAMKNGTFGSQQNGTCNGHSNGVYNGQTNGMRCHPDTVGDESELHNNSSDTHNKSSAICIRPSDVSKVRNKSSDKSIQSNGLSIEAKKNIRTSNPSSSRTTSISVDFRLSRGISAVNEGNYAEAVSIFDQILKANPTYPEALIGRGTAYAFKRELDAAIADFTNAIKLNPSAGEAWKRRGQAHAALGKSAQAITDLTKALEFEPNSTDTLHERGIVNFKFKDFGAAIEDLSECVKLDQDNKSAYTFLGSALSSVGRYKNAEVAHMKAIRLDPNYVEAWAHLTQLHHDMANSEKAFECLQQVLQIDGRFAKAYYLRGRLLHAMGEHRKAIEDLTISLSLESSSIECLYLRASCYHAIGEYKEAVKDYDGTLDLEMDSMEKFVLQCLAFYQKEIALYTASRISSEFSWFNIDGDINPLFKEYWCKKLHPKNVCEKVFRQPPLRESLKKNKLRKLDLSLTKPKTVVIQAADSLGKKLQYNCPGFLPNRRQHRMAGLAAIEIAQRVWKTWRSLQGEWKNSNKGTSKNGKRAWKKEKPGMPSQNRGGACCSTSTTSETSGPYSVTDDRSPGRPMMLWHDVYSIAVKWRQISEPCDPVVWINKLSEEFNSGFGSHTPLVLGQAKVVRYYPNFQRTLDLAKAVIKEKKFVYNKKDKIIDLSDNDKIQNVLNAESCSELYKIIGEDFWLATWCKSTASEGRHLEGTRITLIKMGEHGYDFAIRTPCTPARWEDFESEMTSAWEDLCNAYCGESYGATDFGVLENVRDTILRMTYYWYNFMPLSRGSAAVGFTVLLGLFLAANMKFTGSIPKGLQVDWEAILSTDPNSFVNSVKRWLYPSLKVTTCWKDYPDVASTFETTGSVIAALSTYSE